MEGASAGGWGFSGVLFPGRGARGKIYKQEGFKNVDVSCTKPVLL